MTPTIFHGAALDVLRTLPDASVDCCVTSPPYYQLRNYDLPPTTWGDGWVGCLGLEPTPDQYVAHMVEVFREVGRVLCDHGGLWLNLGDSYAKTSSYSVPRTMHRENGWKSPGRGPSAGRPVKAKSLIGIPWRVALALIDDGWILRNEIAWVKPNAQPSSAKDKLTPSHEKIFFFTKQGKGAYFDDYAGREPSTGRSSGNSKREHHGLSGLGANVPTDACDTRHGRDVWTMATASYKGAHYAVFPKKLPEKCIELGCPRVACAICNAPRRRVVERKSLNRYELPLDHPEYRPRRYDEKKAGDGVYAGNGQRFSVVKSKGFEPSCDCNSWTRPGVVLDPFLGSGTTAAVARELERHCIGIELNLDYLKHTFERLSAA